MEKKLLHVGVLLVVDWILEGLAVKKKKKIGQKLFNAWIACLVATARTMRNLEEERKKKKKKKRIIKREQNWEESCTREK